MEHEHGQSTPDYDLFVVEFDNVEGSTILPQLRDQRGQRHDLDPDALPLAPRAVRRATPVTFAAAVAHAGAARVRHAIAAAEHRRRRESPSAKRLETAARLADLLTHVENASATGAIKLEIGAASPRTRVPASAPIEDHNVLLRIESGNTTMKVTASPETPSEPTVVHGGRIWDISVPEFYHTAARLASNEARRRPPAIELAALIQLVDRLDATRFTARFASGDGDEARTLTAPALMEQLLLRCWPVVTAGDRESAWTLPVASQFQGHREAASASLDREHNRVRVTAAGVERLNEDGEILDRLVNHLTAATKIRAHPRWSTQTTQSLAEARPNRRESR